MADEKDAGAEGKTEGEGEVSFSDAWKEAAAEEQGASKDQPDPLDEPAKKEDEAGQGQDAPPAGEAEGKPPASQESTDDIWANADPKFREAFQSERDKAVRLEQQLRTQDGRLSSAQRQLNQLRQQLAPKRDAEGAAEEGKEAKDEEERLKQLREEYPDVAAPLLDKIAKLEGVVGSLTTQTQVSLEAEGEALTAREEAKLLERHSDWGDYGEKGKSNKEFVEWVMRQPRYIIEGVQRNGSEIVDSVEVSDILDRFKKETGRIADQAQRDAIVRKRENQLEAARQPANRQPAVASGSEDDFSSEWNRLKAIDQRKAANR